MRYVSIWLAHVDSPCVAYLLGKEPIIMAYPAVSAFTQADLDYHIRRLQRGALSIGADVRELVAELRAAFTCDPAMAVEWAANEADWHNN